MGQPIRQKVAEVHADLIKEPTIYTLLIDGNSLLFLSFADTKMNSRGEHYGGVFQFLLQVKMMLQKKEWDYVYSTFDNEYSGKLRWDIYKPYKANRDKHYDQYGESDYYKAYEERLKNMMAYCYSKSKKKPVDDTHELTASEKWDKFVDENFDRERDILCRYFNELYIRWFMDDVVEGDDFIAYYCMHKKPNEKIVIMSGDMDLTQLISDDIAVYNLKEKKFITPNNFKQIFGYHYENVAVRKIFCGDTSDNIGNINLLSEERFVEIMPEVNNRKITVSEVIDRARSLNEERVKSKKKPLKLYDNIINGVSKKQYDGDFYEINRKLIDLHEPILTDEAKEEIDSMMYAPMDPEDRSIGNLYRMMLEDGIDELKSDTKFGSFFAPFKRIEAKEVKRYEESVKKS